MPRVKFLVDTQHPDYGQVKKGDVLEVGNLYAEHYEALGTAEPSDADASRAEPKNATQREADPSARRRIALPSRDDDK